MSKKEQHDEIGVEGGHFLARDTGSLFEGRGDRYGGGRLVQGMYVPRGDAGCQ